MHTPEEIESSKIELANDLKDLLKNKKFKRIILEGFLESGSTFLTKNLTKVKDDVKPAIVEEMAARSILWKYLDNIEEEANSIIEARNFEAKEV